jgi:rhamnose transport system substrate-binding protein
MLLIFSMLLAACAPAVAPAPAAPAAEATEPAAAEAAGEGVPMVLMPKFLGILVFDQAYQGALEAHKEVGNPAELQSLMDAAAN